MDKKEFQEKIAEQKRIKLEADVEIQRLRQEYIDSAPIKVGDVVRMAVPKYENGNPFKKLKYVPGEEVRVEGLGIGIGSDTVGVKYVNRKKKNGEFSLKAETPYNGVFMSDGTYIRVTL